MSIDDSITIIRNDKGCQVDLASVTAVPELFAQACKDMYEMFEREVFDVIVSSWISGSVFASSVADRTKRGVIVAKASCSDPDNALSCEYQGHHGTVKLSIPGGLIRKGMRVAIICDLLRGGKDIRALTDMIESQGAKVIKIGCFVEDSDYDARRAVLKGIPMESRVFTEDY